MATDTSTQQAPPHVEPTGEHEWLKQLVGEWTYEAEMIEPGKPPQRAGGSETVRTLGDVWVLGEGRGEMPGGGEGKMLMTIGYDNARGRFVGSWVGSMMSNMFVYDGELDRNRNTLDLYADGPSFTGDGGTAHYRDSVQLVSRDERVLTSSVQGPDGQWTQFMSAHYTRRK
jgi:hypothetical protein